MLRHIVACIHAGTPGGASLDSAVRVAEKFGGWLTGLYVRDPPPTAVPPVIDPTFPTWPTPAMLAMQERAVADHERRQDELQADAAQELADCCRGSGVDGELKVRTGDAKDEILVGATTADLVVMGRGKDEGSTLGSLAGWLVRHLAHPVMLVGRQPLDLARIGVAYDGSHGAQRALAVAAEIASRWKGVAVSVELIHARSRADEGGAALEAAENYLGRYDVKRHTHHAPGEPSDVILEMAERLDVDLLVAGAYGHSLVREVVLGSTTQEVMARWRLPLLLCR